MDYESKLCDNDVMVLLVLIKTTCLIGLPRCALCPTVHPSQTTLSEGDWVDSVGSVGDTYRSHTDSLRPITENGFD